MRLTLWRVIQDEEHTAYAQVGGFQVHFEVSEARLDAVEVLVVDA